MKGNEGKIKTRKADGRIRSERRKGPKGGWVRMRSRAPMTESNLESHKKARENKRKGRQKGAEIGKEVVRRTSARRRKVGERQAVPRRPGGRGSKDEGKWLHKLRKKGPGTERRGGPRERKPSNTKKTRGQTGEKRRVGLMEARKECLCAREGNTDYKGGAKANERKIPGEPAPKTDKYEGG